MIAAEAYLGVLDQVTSMPIDGVSPDYAYYRLLLDSYAIAALAL